MKSITFLLLMVAISLIIPNAGTAAVWVGAQAGPNFVADGSVKGLGSFQTHTDITISRLKNVRTEPAVLAGIIVGYDFVKEGFGGYAWPNWLKYFSVAVDLTYNDFSQKAQEVQVDSTRGPLTIHITKADGNMITLSLLFMAKYGFFSNPEYPSGRLIPYVGVGPGLVFSRVDTPSSWSGYPSSDSLEPSILTEAGIRYMVLPKVSLDAAFRYRYVYPSYDVDYFSNIGNFHVQGRILAQQFNAIFRVNYHF